MTDIALFLLFTLAIGIGWLLGRRTGKSTLREITKFRPSDAYFQGLNYLLREQPDKAVDAFVKSLEVNSYTLETHLALGKLMRKQGQVDRAIRIHQNLLARPTLEIQDQHQVHLELARDFMAAGLLDRAEMLLQEVIDESTLLRSIAQRYLLDIYQDESEWQDAISVANALLQSRYMKANMEARNELTSMIAHFNCELAEQSIAQKNRAQATDYLQRAAAAQKTLPRVVMMIAENDIANGRYKQAIKSISKFEAQNPAWFFMCLSALLNAYEGADANNGFENFVAHIEHYLAANDATPVLIFLVDTMLARASNSVMQQQRVAALLEQHHARKSGLISANKLVELQLTMAGGDIPQEVKALQNQVGDMLKNAKLYRCGDCGFSGRQLHWRCPSCKSWDSQERLDYQGRILTL
jgi:lipopolysaccharide biosynthesis regulator YciM